jgi:HPt (histidine-containing phosphotransfer) domain-containing protein
VSVLEALVGTNPQLIQEFLDEFAVNAAGLALELSDACKDLQSPVAAGIAHKLKSSSRSVGALRLGDICAAMETAGNAGDLAVLRELLPGFQTEMALVEDFLRSLRVARDEIAEMSI